MTQEIKPCPVCGDTKTNHWGNKNDGFRRKCNLCAWMGPWGLTKERADSRWNSRPETMGDALRVMGDNLSALTFDGNRWWCHTHEDDNSARVLGTPAATPEEAVRKAREGMED